MKSMKQFAAIGLSLAMVMGLAACGKETKPAETKPAAAVETKAPAAETKAPEKKPEEKAPEAKHDLSGWEGEWNNMGAYLELEEVQPAFQELAEKEKVSVEEAKKAYLEKRACEFDGMVVKGDEVTFLKTFPEKKGEVLAQNHYEFVKEVKTKHGNHELTWYGFKAKEADAKYPAIVLLPLHNEEALAHYHMRYGNDVDELLSMEKKWYPTFIAPTSTIEQIKGEIAE